MAGVKHIFCKHWTFALVACTVALPIVALASEIFTTLEYVDETTIAKDQGQANANKVLQVNSGGTASFVAPVTSINTATSNDNSVPTTKSAVTGYAIQKPSTASAGQVLMYDTGANANSQPVAQYIKVPTASADPNVSGTNVSGQVSIWFQ